MFVFVEFNGGSAKAVAMTLVVLLACLILFFLPCFSLCSLILPSPPALCRYLLPRLRVVSSAQQLSVPLQQRILFFLQPFWSSCITFFRTPVGFFLFLFFFCLFRPYAGIVFLVFVLFRPRSSVCCSSCNLSDLLASHSSERLSAFCLFSSYFS